MNKRKFLYQLVSETEDRFERICYAYKEISGGVECWNVCIEDYDLYRSESFKEWKDSWYRKAAEVGANIVFCCCVPSVEKLAKYAEDGDLIIRI